MKVALQINYNEVCVFSQFLNIKITYFRRSDKSEISTLGWILSVLHFQSSSFICESVSWRCKAAQTYAECSVGLAVKVETTASSVTFSRLKVLCFQLIWSISRYHFIWSISRYLFDLSVVSYTSHVIAITKWCTKASPHHYTTVSMTYARVVSVRFYLMSFKYCSLEIFAYITSLNNHHHPRLQCIFTVRDHHLRWKTFDTYSC
jgi:hypothetical protein